MTVAQLKAAAAEVRHFCGIRHDEPGPHVSVTLCGLPEDGAHDRTAVSCQTCLVLMDKAEESGEMREGDDDNGHCYLITREA